MGSIVQVLGEGYSIQRLPKCERQGFLYRISEEYGKESNALGPFKDILRCDSSGVFDWHDVLSYAYFLTKEVVSSLSRNLLLMRPLCGGIAVTLLVMGMLLGFVRRLEEAWIS